jgi:Pentapeptide repeats (9 copies)
MPEAERAEPTPEPIAEPPFVCQCGEWMRVACEGEPFYKEHKGKRFCVLHYPGKGKVAAFDVALQNKLEAKDFNFRGVWFPQAVNFNKFEFSATADFGYATFSAMANFRYATFNAIAYFGSATFSAAADFRYAIFSAAADFNSANFNAKADFSYATFSAAADFRSATFSAAAYFGSAIFRAVANFRSAIFSSAAYFYSATFNAAADFHFATFNAAASFSSAIFCVALYLNESIFSAAADFRSATFKDQVSFFGSQSFGDQSSLDLQYVRIDKPDLVSFHTVTLRPNWFVNVDLRKFIFTDVIWEWKKIRIQGEIQSLTKKKIKSPRGLLKIACRQLAENAEANNRYEEASRFRYWAMDLARQQKRAGLAFWKTDWLHVLYWAVSGYGERMLRAFTWLLAVWIVFALLYTQVGFTKPEDRSTTPTANPITTTEPDTIGQPLLIKRAFTYSLGVMSLQKPEPKPLTGTAQTLVLLETILGPLQAALLALAIRRKFMR